MRYGLIGERLSHSYSKEIHGSIADYDYELLELRPNELEGFCRAREFCGINVTIPYKKDIMPYLDEISSDALAIGAVNTVVNKGGRLYGYNTDFYGMRELIESIGVSCEGKKVLILGTGGTSLTANAVAKSLGAREVIRVSRTAREGVCSYTQAVEIHRDADIIINTTPCGMYPNVDESPIDISGFENLSGVIDAIYNPLKTRLILDAESRGIRAAGGLYMLAGQAVWASALFLGKEPDRRDIQRAYSAVKKSKQNIVLIGMPSCGKSTVGRELSKRLSLPFVDSDDEIIKKIGMLIGEYFDKFGEEKFREVEGEIIAELSILTGHIIATGGGAVLRKENVTALKQNGRLIFLDRPLEGLVPTADRPLSSSRADVEKRYRERYPIYTAVADEIIDNSGNLGEAINEILKGF